MRTEQYCWSEEYVIAVKITLNGPSNELNISINSELKSSEQTEKRNLHRAIVKKSDPFQSVPLISLRIAPVTSKEIDGELVSWLSFS